MIINTCMHKYNTRSMHQSKKFELYFTYKGFIVFISALYISISYLISYFSHYLIIFHNIILTQQLYKGPPPHPPHLTPHHHSTTTIPEYSTQPEVVSNDHCAVPLSWWHCYASTGLSGSRFCIVVECFDRGLKCSPTLNSQYLIYFGTVFEEYHIFQLIIDGSL